MQLTRRNQNCLLVPETATYKTSKTKLATSSFLSGTTGWWPIRTLLDEPSVFECLEGEKETAPPEVHRQPITEP